MIEALGDLEMLADNPIDPMILATDLGVAKGSTATGSGSRS